MASIAPLTIQHIVQMGTATEKLQHTLQNLPLSNGQHNQEERKIADEQKRFSIQKPELANPSNTVDSNGSQGKQHRRKRKTSDLEQEEEKYKRTIKALEENQGKTIDVVV